MTDVMSRMIEYLELKYGQEALDAELWQIVRKRLIGDPGVRHIVERRLERNAER